MFTGSVFIIGVGYWAEYEAMNSITINKPSIYQQNMYQFIQLSVGGISGGLIALDMESALGVGSGGVSGVIGIAGTIYEAILL